MQARLHVGLKLYLIKRGFLACLTNLGFIAVLQRFSKTQMGAFLKKRKCDNIAQMGVSPKTLM